MLIKMRVNNLGGNNYFKKSVYTKKIIPITLTGMIILLLFSVVPTMAADPPEIIRSITPDTVYPGDEVTVEITFTAPDDIGACSITDFVPDGWSATDLSSIPSANFMEFHYSRVDFIWWILPIPNGTPVSASYTLQVPSDAEAGEYSLSGYSIANRPESGQMWNVSITGEDTVTVSAIEPTISIYTDKFTYTTGDTMQVGLDITNPGSALTACVAVWLEGPSGGIIAVPLHAHTVTLPGGLDFTNPSLMSFTLPNMPAGTYTWHAAIMDPPTHSIIAEDDAEWDFVPTRASVEDLEGLLKQTTVDLWF